MIMYSSCWPTIIRLPRIRCGISRFCTYKTPFKARPQDSVLCIFCKGKRMIPIVALKNVGFHLYPTILENGGDSMQNPNHLPSVIPWNLENPEKQKTPLLLSRNGGFRRLGTWRPRLVRIVAIRLAGKYSICPKQYLEEAKKNQGEDGSSPLPVTYYMLAPIPPVLTVYLRVSLSNRRF